MVREIMRDEAFLAQRAEPAAQDDLGAAQDLLDTLTAHKDVCAGMAANMTGVRKAKRRKTMKVQYRDAKFQTRFKTFTGRAAQIIVLSE